MGYNLVLTVVHIIGLMQRDYGASLWQMLFEDGLLCYIVAFAANVLPAVSDRTIISAMCFAHQTT